MNDFITLAEQRYSVRKFRDTPVEEEKIAKILEAARLAPTACNYQPQKIYVIRSEQMRQAMKQVTPCTFDAPVIFVIGFDENLSAKGMIHESHDFGDTDAAIACTHMMLEAADLGLGTCWVGMFQEEKVRQALGLPANIRIRDLLPTGYPAEDSRPAPLHAKSRDISAMAEEL